MSNSPFPGLDWPALQFIGQILGFVAAIIAVAVATHNITRKITSLTSALDKKVAVLEERVNNIKDQADKSENDLKSQLDKVEVDIQKIESWNMEEARSRKGSERLRSKLKDKESSDD